MRDEGFGFKLIEYLLVNAPSLSASGLLRPTGDFGMTPLVKAFDVASGPERS